MADNMAQRVRTAMMLRLTQLNIPSDTLELLVYGDPAVGVGPDAIGQVAQAAVEEMTGIMGERDYVPLLEQKIPRE